MILAVGFGVAVSQDIPGFAQAVCEVPACLLRAGVGSFPCCNPRGATVC